MDADNQKVYLLRLHHRKLDAKIDSIEAFLKRYFFVFDFKDELVKAYFHI